jgi:hypothetical protein
MMTVLMNRARLVNLALIAAASLCTCANRGAAAGEIGEIHPLSGEPALASASGVTSTFDSDGDVRPGNSPGIMNFGGDVTFGAAATLEIELAGITPGTGYDQVKVAGQLTLGGTLKVLLTGLTPAAGQTFDILDWGSRVGTFSSLNLPTLSGLNWNLSQLYTNGVLGISAISAPGDYNSNGFVDAADYAVWRKNVGTTTPLPNDPTGGTIGTTQYNTWRANFGKTGGSGTSLLSVPEPITATPGLVLFGMSLVARRILGRRARRS